MSSNSFSSIIQDFFRRNGGWLRLKGELAVYFWPKIAGPEIAKQVVANHFRAGTLYLQTDSPALAHQLQMMNSDILKKYQKLLGINIVKGVRVKIGALNIKPEIYKIKEQPILSSTEKELIEDCGRNITDPNLANKFKNLMQSSFINQHLKQTEGGGKCLSCGIIVEKEFNFCPGCERKVKEEAKAYFEYQRKNNISMTTDDLSKIEAIQHLHLYKL